MRILQVHNRYRERGGEDVVVETECQLLRDAGHEVEQHLVSNPPGAGAAAALAFAPWNPQQRRVLRARARAYRPDVAHVHNTWFSLTPAAIAGLADAGTPVVLSLHNFRVTCSNGLLLRDGRPCSDCVEGSPWNGLRHRCYKDSTVASAAAAATVALGRRDASWWRHVSCFVALNDFARDIFVRAGIPGDRVVVKPNVIADTGPRSTPPSASDVVLYVGRLTAEKGLRTLLDAWELAAPTGLRLVVVGAGPLRAELEQRAVPGVELRGVLPANEVAAAMRTARALAFPSEWFEGQPMVLLEAFAAGLPVLASQLGGTPAEVAALGAGWLVRPGATEAWAAALSSLVTRDDLDATGARARQRYVERFSPTVGLANLEAIYRRTLEGG